MINEKRAAAGRIDNNASIELLLLYLYAAFVLSSVHVNERCYANNLELNFRSLSVFLSHNFILMILMHYILT